MGMEKLAVLSVDHIRLLREGQEELRQGSTRRGSAKVVGRGHRLGLQRRWMLQL